MDHTTVGAVAEVDDVPLSDEELKIQAEVDRRVEEIADREWVQQEKRREQRKIEAFTQAAELLKQAADAAVVGSGDLAGNLVLIAGTWIDLGKM